MKQKALGERADGKLETSNNQLGDFECCDVCFVHFSLWVLGSFGENIL